MHGMHICMECTYAFHAYIHSTHIYIPHIYTFHTYIHSTHIYIPHIYIFHAWLLPISVYHPLNNIPYRNIHYLIVTLAHQTHCLTEQHRRHSTHACCYQCRKHYGRRCDCTIGSPECDYINRNKLE